MILVDKQEMVYDSMFSRDIATKILYLEKFDDGAILVLNIRGSHPCAYVQFDSVDFLKANSYDDFDVLDAAEYVHHGFTFFGTMKNNCLNGFWLGWDYAHLGDAIHDEDKEGKRWTTDELITAAKAVYEDFHNGRYKIYHDEEEDEE